MATAAEEPSPKASNASAAGKPQAKAGNADADSGALQSPDAAAQAKKKKREERKRQKAAAAASLDAAGTPLMAYPELSSAQEAEELPAGMAPAAEQAAQAKKQKKARAAGAVDQHSAETAAVQSSLPGLQDAAQIERSAAAAAAAAEADVSPEAAARGVVGGVRPAGATQVQKKKRRLRRKAATVKTMHADLFDNSPVAMPASPHGAQAAQTDGSSEDAVKSPFAAPAAQGTLTGRPQKLDATFV